MKREARRQLSIQYSLARVRSLIAFVERQPIDQEIRREITMRLGWTEQEIDNINTANDDHAYSGGIDCGCHDPFRGPKQPKANCRACGGAGTITRESMRLAIAAINAPAVPYDFPVRPVTSIDGRALAKALATCGTCGRSWDDGEVTSMTPTPSGRCPFEAFHEEIS